MGPRSNDRGNEIPQPSGEFEDATLQWGRDQMIAEMVPQPPVFKPTLRASMGPRSNDRGNGSYSQKCIHHWRASMGPRSNDRGNDQGPQAIGYGR